MSTGLKKFFIILIYLLILAVIVFLVYLRVKSQPGCFDNILNQNEENIDCGGVCAKKCPIVPQVDIQTGTAGSVPSGLAGQYDLYVEVSNPNNIYGVKSFQYKFEAVDSAGRIIAEKSGSRFILPGEKKYIIENNISMAEVPANVRFTTAAPEWVEFNSNYLEKPDLKVINKQYTETSGINFSEATGLVKNESPYDFTSIKVEVILKDEVGKIVALNFTQLNTVKAGENRDFRVMWPSRFPGNVRIVDVQTDVNMYNSESFVKQYYKTPPAGQ